MKQKLITVAVLLLFSLNLNSQCYEVLSDLSGMDISSYQSELEDAACSLRDSFPNELKDDFMVFDFGFYSLNESMAGGYEAVWEKIKSDAASKSRYYLLFGKLTGSAGVYNQFWVDLKLPDENIFYCIDQLSPNLRENLRLRYQAIANEVHENNGKSPFQYAAAEIEVMAELGEYIGGLKDCCDYQRRSSSSCSACVLSASQYNRVLDNNEILGIEIDKVIDNTTPVMGQEEIGYEIEVNGNQINLDDAMNILKQEINADYPSATIKIYPCNYTETCSDFNEVLNNFKTDNVDIGILIGVIGVDGEEGTLRWQMISNDDTEPNPTTFESDTCFYFNEEKVYTHKEFCAEGITPRGVLQNLDGFSFDYNFRFADPELTPKTLITSSIKDSLGNWINYGSTEEPLLNEAYLMGKDEIFARLATSIPDNNGNSQHTAFDYHFFAPWTLYWESGGNSAPFDFSAKAFFLDRQNYIFITDDGDNVVGHNFRNMGNFLWGAATYIMGVPQWMALAGAHGQNIFGEFGDGGLDSPDDQYSIKLGRYYAKQMDWQTIYGGKNNIFRK